MSQGLRLLYVCSDEGVPLFGMKGCSAHLREMSLAFAFIGCRVRLVVANAQGPSASSFGIEYEEIVPPTSRKLGFDLRKIILDRRFFRGLDRVIKEFEPDIIFEQYDLYARAGAKIASRYRIPHVLQVHAPLVWEQRDRIHFPRLAKVFERKTYRQADLLIGVSPAVCRMLRGISPDGPVLLVENGVNETVFNEGVSGSEVRQRYALGGNTVVGYVGSLKDWQGVATLIQASSILLAERDDIRFLIVGGGNNLVPYREWARALGLADKVFLTGPKPHAEVPSYIAASDVCVAPYAPSANFYFSPMKIREYVAMRKPIVASNVPQIAKTIRDNVDGLLTRPGDEKDLASKIAVMLDDAALRDRLARTAHERWAGKLSWLNCARRVLEATKGQVGG